MLERIANAATTLVCIAVLIVLALAIFLQATTVPDHCADMTPREADTMCATSVQR